MPKTRKRWGFMWDENVIRGMIRACWFGLVIGCGFVLKLISDWIGNERLSKLLKRVFIAIAIFVGCLISGAITDTLLGFEVAYATSGVNIAFWGYILFILARFAYLLWKDRHRLDKTDEPVAPRAAERIDKSLDELFAAVESVRFNARILRKDMSRYTK